MRGRSHPCTYLRDNDSSRQSAASYMPSMCNPSCSPAKTTDKSWLAQLANPNGCTFLLVLSMLDGLACCLRCSRRGVPLLAPAAATPPLACQHILCTKWLHITKTHWLLPGPTRP